MPLEVGPERVDHRDDPHLHAVLVAGPLVEARRGGAGQDREADLAVEGHHAPELAGRREHDVVILDLEEVAQGTVRPLIRGVLATGRAETRLAGVRYDPDLVPIRALVHVAAQGRRPARQQLAHGLEHHRPDPPHLGLEELLPVRRENVGDPVADLLADGQHREASTQVAPPNDPDPPPRQRSGAGSRAPRWWWGSWAPAARQRKEGRTRLTPRSHQAQSSRREVALSSA